MHSKWSDLDSVVGVFVHSNSEREHRHAGCLLPVGVSQRSRYCRPSRALSLSFANGVTLTRRVTQHNRLLVRACVCVQSSSGAEDKPALPPSLSRAVKKNSVLPNTVQAGYARGLPALAEAVRLCYYSRLNLWRPSINAGCSFERFSSA